MDELLAYFQDKRNLINLLVLLILLLGIPITFAALKNARLLGARADVKPIELVNNTCVISRNGQQVATCPQVIIKLTSPLGGPATTAAN
jgi:hypothetical protein